MSESEQEVAPVTEDKEQFQDKLQDENKFLRGVFMRLGGDYQETYIIQIDPGNSRSLYDNGDKEKLLTELIRKLCGPKSGITGYWIDRKNPKLQPRVAVCNENFQIEQIMDIGSALHPSTPTAV